MKTAIDVNRVTGAERECATREGRGCPPDILRLSPAGHGRQAGCDLLVVVGRGHGGHVGSNDAWPDLEHSDAGLSQPRGEQPRRHADGGF